MAKVAVQRIIGCGKTVISTSAFWALADACRFY